METLDPTLIGTVVLTSGMAYAMVRLAMRLNMLEQRSQRRCPSCGIYVPAGRGCHCMR